MDGHTLLYRLRMLLAEDSTSTFLDTRSSYEYLWEAAQEFVRRSKCLKATQSITTVADQTGYDLNADFIEPALMNADNEYYIKYDDGTTVHFLTFKDYQDVVYANNTDSVSVPSHYTITDKSSLYDRVTGTTTSAGASSGGECTLTDTAADFSDVQAGDYVHNTTDGSAGIVLSKTSSTVLVVALFGGTDNDWTSGDSYVIQPQGRLQLQLDPPPSTAGHTITVEYIQRPAPVFSDYGMYRIQATYQDALIKYALWLYAYKDRESSTGNAYYQFFDNACRRASEQLNTTLGRRDLKVNLKKRQ